MGKLKEALAMTLTYGVAMSAIMTYVVLNTPSLRQNFALTAFLWFIGVTGLLHLTYAKESNILNIVEIRFIK